MLHHLLYWYLIPGLWSAWGLYWLVSARDVKVTVRREPLWQRWAHVLPIFFGVGIIVVDSPASPLFSMRILPFSRTTYWVGIAVLFLGLAFAISARRYLGTNWSGTVTVKENHELIRSGPYRWVRHPIYTGILTGVLGTAICRGELRGVWGLAICTLGFVLKLRREERWMRETFGEEYDRYRAHVPILVPFTRF
jgi:protein-S-isoprenylcysteine O-methyltransferase Ste14